MIFGNPELFAVQCDPIAAWNRPGDTWINGVFELYINGFRVFKSVDVVELRTTIRFYQKIEKSFSAQPVTEEASILYKEANDYFYGDCESLRVGLFSMSCTAMEDRQCYVYVMRDCFGDRFIWNDGCGGVLREFLAPSQALDDVIFNLTRQNIIH